MSALNSILILVKENLIFKHICLLNCNIWRYLIILSYVNCEYVSSVFFLQELVMLDVQSMSDIIKGSLIRQLYTMSFDCIYTGTSLFKFMICRCVGKIDIIRVCRKQVAIKNGGKKIVHIAAPITIIQTQYTIYTGSKPKIWNKHRIKTNPCNSWQTAIQTTFYINILQMPKLWILQSIILLARVEIFNS